ncbi:MAG: F0F1 ATP synthase subunit B [Putridiphycobacter sp.]|nr:F0F1 ATP synthase subunit B [Putridiphycobacter sp.]
MELITPSVGTIIWSSIVFIILMLLLAKFAWKPMLKAVNDREASIADSLALAEKTKAEMAQLQSENEALLKEARVERDKIIKEANEASKAMVAEAKDKAQAEADKIIGDAHKAITNEKNAAMSEIKSHVAALSLEIAEKVIKGELASSDKQKALASQLAEDISVN